MGKGNDNKDNGVDFHVDYNVVCARTYSMSMYWKDIFEVVLGGVV